VAIAVGIGRAVSGETSRLVRGCSLNRRVAVAVLVCRSGACGAVNWCSLQGHRRQQPSIPVSNRFRI
jgi:hypothetical protein